MSTQEVMKKVESGELTMEQGFALVAEQAKVEAVSSLKTSAPAWQLKVGYKGGVIFHGAGDKPLTLAGKQWEFLLSHKEDILAFIEKHKEKLAGYAVVPAVVADAA